MKKKIVIEGMSCNHCVMHVKEALESIAENVNVNLEEKYATVETTASDEILKDLIDEAGYDVATIENL